MDRVGKVPAFRILGVSAMWKRTVMIEDINKWGLFNHVNNALFSGGQAANA